MLLIPKGLFKQLSRVQFHESFYCSVSHELAGVVQTCKQRSEGGHPNRLKSSCAFGSYLCRFVLTESFNEEKFALRSEILYAEQGALANLLVGIYQSFVEEREQILRFEVCDNIIYSALHVQNVKRDQT